MGRINWDKWGIFLSPLHDTIYLAHISKRYGKIVEADDKKDITSEFWGVLITLLKRNENEVIIYENDMPKYRIVLEELEEEA